MAVWRNGSASDYESGGCSFEYYLGHVFPFLMLRRDSEGGPKRIWMFFFSFLEQLEFIPCKNLVSNARVKQ